MISVFPAGKGGQTAHATPQLGQPNARSRFRRSQHALSRGDVLCGILIAVLSSFWAGAPGQTAELAPFRILEDNTGRIDQFVIQIAEGEFGRLLPTIHDLLTQIDPRTEGYFVCADRDEAAALANEIQGWNLAQPERFQILLLPEVATIWARDRFVAVRRQTGEPTLLLPPPREPAGGDFWVPHLLARWIPGLALRPSDFYLEGGDLIAGRKQLFVGATTVGFAVDEIRGCTEAELRVLLERQFGKKVVFLPDFADQDEDPTDMDYHLDMFLTVCHDDSVVLADLGWGERLGGRRFRLHEQLRLDKEDRQAIHEDLETKRRRLDAVYACLVRAGIRVHRVPLLWIPEAECGMTYNNVLQEESPAGPIVYLPQYGIEELDLTAADVYSNLGYEVRPVDVRQVFELQGTLRCVVNVIRREPALNGEDGNLQISRSHAPSQGRTAVVPKPRRKYHSIWPTDSPPFKRTAREGRVAVRSPTSGASPGVSAVPAR